MQRKNNNFNTFDRDVGTRGALLGNGEEAIFESISVFLFFWHNSGIHVWQAFKLLTIFNPFEYPPYKQKLEKIKTQNFLYAKYII